MLGVSCTLYKKASSVDPEENLTKYRKQYPNNQSGGKQKKPTPKKRAEVHPKFAITEALDDCLSDIKEKNAQGHTKMYTVQLYVGSRREKAFKCRNDTYKLFGVRPNLIYIKPNYKVCLGKFVDRVEAQQMYAKVLRKFPDAKVGVILVPNRLAKRSNL